MMALPPRLKLNRFKVLGGGKVVFDQPFNNGVNIIAGMNGSGKSTIADLIFFGLGGDVLKWKEHATRCSETLTEIETNNGTLTLRREIDEFSSQSPMFIYYGPMDEAEGSLTGWHRHPYKRQESGKQQSFSQILFKALGIPEAISENTSNITMNQILRLIYVDQMSSVQRIFKDDVTRDTPETRQAVSDLLCGIGGYDLYENEMKLRAKTKDFKEVSSELKNLMMVAGSTADKKVRGDQITEELIKANETLASKKDELQQASADFSQDEELNKEAEKDRKQLLSQLQTTKRRLQDRESEVTTIALDVQDTKEFVDYLKGTLDAFDEASFTYNQLGQIEFEYCPSCFTPVHDREHKEGHCKLCGSEVDHQAEKEKVFEVRIDLTQQLRESEHILKEREQKLATVNKEVSGLRRLHGNQVALYSSLTKTSMTGRESLMASLNREIGGLEQKIETLNERMELAKRIDKLVKEKSDLQGEINDLEADIALIEASRKDRETEVKTAIAEAAVEFVKQDLEARNDFLEALDYVGFDFTDDWMAINGKRNVSRSASGMVILKNSLFMALFQTSVNDSKFNYPRFIIIDNVEDKGMEQLRSHNFQKLICDASDKLTKQHQIIFTTSMLNPELDQPHYLVGRKYDDGHKTLNFDGIEEGQVDGEAGVSPQSEE